MDGASMRSVSRRSSWRTSTFSNAAQTDRSYTTIDIGVQTDFETSATSPSGTNSIRKSTMTDIAEHKSEDKQDSMGDEAPKSSLDLAKRQKEETHVTNGVTAEKNVNIQDTEPSADPEVEAEQSVATPTIFQPIPLEPESDDEEDEEAVIHTVHQAATPQRAIHARLVSVKKQLPPALPPRNPIRDRKRPLIITGDNLYDDEYDSKDQGTSATSRGASVSSQYKSEVEETSSGRSLSSVDLTEEMKHEGPVRPSADELEARTPSPSKQVRSPGSVHRSRSPSPRKSSRSPSPAKISRSSSPVKQSMPGQF